MESDGKVRQACAAIVVADALLEKPKRKRKKLVNDNLFERMTKGSYGGLLTELCLEKEIFKEYLRMIEYLCIQYFCIHQRYCILQRYRVSQPAVVIQSFYVWRDEDPHSIFGPLHRCHTKRPPTVTARTALRKPGSEHARIMRPDTCIFQPCCLCVQLWVNLLHAADEKYIVYWGLIGAIRQLFSHYHFAVATVNGSFLIIIAWSLLWTALFSLSLRGRYCERLFSHNYCVIATVDSSFLIIIAWSLLWTALFS